MKRLVLIGASYAEGLDLEGIREIEFINKGVSGEGTSQFLVRFERDVICLRPWAVVIWGYINDLFASHSREIDVAIQKLKGRVQEMVSGAQENQIEPILTTELTIRGPDSLSEKAKGGIGRILRKSSYQDFINGKVLAINEWIRKFAKSKNLILLDFQPLMADQDGRRKKEYAAQDGIHISEKGYQELATYARKIIDMNRNKNFSR